MRMFCNSSVQWTLIASVTSSFLMAMSLSARAAGAGCAAVQAAVAIQAKTPFRATISSATGNPAPKTEMVWINNTLYIQMGGRWIGGPMPPERALVGVTGGNLPYSDFKQLPGATIAGQPATVYSAVVQSGEHAQLFVSTTSGQLVREILDVNTITVTADFDYSNARASAQSK
jgi:hypothetical protein